MKRKFLHGVYGLVFASVFFVLASVLTSCGGNDDPDDPDEPAGRLKRTVLLYAVASNNLSGNLIDDKNEMLQAAREMNMKDLSMLVYEVTVNGNPKLSEIVRQPDGSYAYSIVKEYDKSLYSTDPQRISQVITDACQLRPADHYGLVLWSHGTGIDPSFSTHPTKSDDMISSDFSGQMAFSFGSDNDPNKRPDYNDKTDIDELADAIPDGVFDFIWFDACYMSGIEMIYELRDKCDYFVGYPTEVFTPGMPYHLTMPCFLRETPDLVEGAKAFFTYYSESSDPSWRVATVAVVDMNKIEPVADLCRKVYPGSAMLPTLGLQKYTRGSIGPFYDFGQVTRLKASGSNGNADSNAFDKAMSEFVVWSAATDRDFSNNKIEKENYSGISCHLFDPASTGSKDSFYRTLDWYERIYQTSDN